MRGSLAGFYTILNEHPGVYAEDNEFEMVNHVDLSGLKCDEGHTMVEFIPEISGWCCNECGDDLKINAHCLHDELRRLRRRRR